MRLRVEHTTTYKYPWPARDSHNELRLMPITDAEQTCLDFRLSLDPAARLFHYDLPEGRVHHFNIRPPHSHLFISAHSLVETFSHDPFTSLQLISDDMEFYRREGVRRRYYEYLAPTSLVPLEPETDRISTLAQKQSGPAAASFLITLTRLLHRVLEYRPGSTSINTPIKEVLAHGKGVCQDFSHLMLAVCRRRGIPSRYVSGYLYTGDRPDDALLGGDAMHAWVECLLPDGHWRGFDPTNNLLVHDGYMKVFTGRDYRDVTPIRGLYRGPAEHNMETFVKVGKEPDEQ